MQVNPNVNITSMVMNPPGTLTVSGTVAENNGAPQTVTVTIAWTPPPAGSPLTATTTSNNGMWSVTITGVPVGTTVEVSATSGNTTHTRDYPPPPPPPVPPGGSRPPATAA